MPRKKPKAPNDIANFICPNCEQKTPVNIREAQHERRLEALCLACGKRFSLEECLTHLSDIPEAQQLKKRFQWLAEMRRQLRPKR